MESTHQPKRNSPDRAAMLADRRRDQESRTGAVLRPGAKRSLSTRGEAGQSWRTKRWTNARWKDLDALEQANFDLGSRLQVNFDARRDRLRPHIAMHPNDFGAKSALDRLST